MSNVWYHGPLKYNMYLTVSGGEENSTMLYGFYKQIYTWVLHSQTSSSQSVAEEGRWFVEDMILSLHRISNSTASINLVLFTLPLTKVCESIIQMSM